MKLMKWLKSRCRKKRCKYPLHFSGREGNIVDMQPKTRKDNRRTEGAIAHHEYEEAGEKNIIHSIQNPKSKPKTKKSESLNSERGGNKSPFQNLEMKLQRR